MPVSVGGGVVDGEGLYDFHACGYGPVDEASQVAEVSYSIAVLAAEGEDWDYNACEAPCVLAEPECFSVVHVYLTVGNVVVDNAVVSLFPAYKLVCGLVDDYIFIFKWKGNGVGIDGQEPVVLSHILHGEIFGGTPRPHCGMAADDGYGLWGLYLWCGHPEEECLAV